MSEIDPKKFRLYESCLIKSIRRCLVDDSAYWAKVLIDLDKEDIVWRRLFIHLSEDIGLANTYLPATIKALFENYHYLKVEIKASFEPDGAHYLPLMHAVMLMANSEKSRAVDNALTYFEDQHRSGNTEVREVPDYATDFHSPKGRRMGRDVKHFYEVAGLIKNETKDFLDIWRSRIMDSIK